MLLNTQECLKAYGSYYAINRAVASGRLRKLEIGIYSDDHEYVPTEQIMPKQVMSFIIMTIMRMLSWKTSILPISTKIANIRVI